MHRLPRMPLRVAMIAPPFLPVPPPRYGGTELVVHELCRVLADAGCDVTLFATGDSSPPPGVRLRSRTPLGSWPPEPWTDLEHALWAVREIARGGYDVVHVHAPTCLPLLAELDVPVVCHLHHAREEPLAAFYRRHASPRVRYVAISERQAALHPELDCNVVHHGLDETRYWTAPDEGYAMFLGRLSRVKGPLDAVLAARAAHVPLRVFGTFHGEDGVHDVHALKHELQTPGVHHLGEIGFAAKASQLSRARALLFPIAWEEPFGLALIEAMLSGTPVLAYPRGSVPELIEEGVTGFIAHDAAEMAELLGHLGGFDRERCRARAIERFSARRMGERVLSVYTELAGGGTGAVAARGA